MASNMTVQSVLGKISQDHLECSICSYRYKQPKLLDCLHSFCLICLQELRQRQEPESTKLTCPLCRQNTTLKEDDAATLPDNFTLGALVEEFRMQEQLLEGQGSEIKCQNCDKGIEAVSRCMNCNCFLCLECDKAHRQMASMKTHEVTTLAQLRSGEISYKEVEYDRRTRKAQAAEPPCEVTSRPVRYWQIMTEKHKFCNKGTGKTNFKSVTQVAAFSDNNVVIVDAECKHLIIMTLSLKSPTSAAFSRELEIEDLHNPICVAVNRHDQLIVLAGPVVKIFNRTLRRYKFRRQFKPGDCRKPNSKPTCLAVDNMDLIAVGYQNKEEISLHRPGGNLIRILPAPGIGRYLTISKDRFIYTNCKKLQSVDYHGTVVFSNEIRANDSIPCDAEGLCCDSDGNIYVAFSLYNNEKDEIHFFTPDGKHRGRVIKGCNYADGMVIIPSGDLVVAAGSSVKFYRRREEYE